MSSQSRVEIVKFVVLLTSCATLTECGFRSIGVSKLQISEY
jgi:hypothetical protein